MRMLNQFSNIHFQDNSQSHPPLQNECEIITEYVNSSIHKLKNICN